MLFNGEVNVLKPVLALGRNFLKFWLPGQL